MEQRMTDLITEARELCKYSEKIVNQLHTERLGYELEYMPLIETIQVASELCDALENTEKQLQEQFDKTGAWLEEYNEMKIALEKAEKDAQRWISVSERLPEEKGKYLVSYHPCWWDDVKDAICVGTDTFRGKTTWAKKKFQRVTHWMPLPAPPKEGAEHERD